MFNFKWLERICVNKEGGHTEFFDLYVDTDTNVQYIGNKNVLIPRLNADGKPYIK